MKKFAILVAVVLVALVCLGGVLFLRTKSDDPALRFKAGIVHIENVHAKNINIFGCDNDKVEVEVDGYQEEDKFNIFARDGVLQVLGEKPRSIPRGQEHIFRSYSKPEVSLILWVPRGTIVEMNNVKANIHIGDTGAPLFLDIEGDLLVEAVNTLSLVTRGDSDVDILKNLGDLYLAANDTSEVQIKETYSENVLVNTSDRGSVFIEKGAVKYFSVLATSTEDISARDVSVEELSITQEGVGVVKFESYVGDVDVDIRNPKGVVVVRKVNGKLKRAGKLGYLVLNKEIINN